VKKKTNVGISGDRSGKDDSQEEQGLSGRGEDSEMGARWGRVRAAREVKGRKKVCQK